MLPINYLALVVCAVMATVLGFLWFGPFFGKAWRKEMGVSEEESQKAMKDPVMQKKMMKSAGLMAIAALVMAYVVEPAVVGNMYGGSSDLMNGFVTVGWYWLGLVAPVLLGAVLWEGKSWKWWLITAGFYLVDLLIMAAIFVLWPTG